MLTKKFKRCRQACNDCVPVPEKLETYTTIEVSAMKNMYIAVIAGTLAAMSSAMQAQAGGAEIYNAKCMACHASGAAGAPKVGDTAAWAPRIATGMDALVASVTNGKGSMPPKGACADCSADDIAAAVEHMVGNSK